MSRLAISSDPIVALQQQVDLLRLAIEQLQKGNPLNNASVDSGSGIQAGGYQVAPTGILMPWSGSVEAVHQVVGRVNTRAGQALSDATGAADAARAAQARADQAYREQSAKPTTAYVDARDRANATAAQNAHSRANAAYSLAGSKPSQGYVVGRDLALQAQINWILDNAAFKPTRHTDPPPRVNG